MADAYRINDRFTDMLRLRFSAPPAGPGGPARPGGD
jgi:hypothetical protein